MFLLNNIKSQDTHLRSLVKSLTWRIVSTLLTGIIAFFVTGEIRIALIIGSIEFFIKFGIYYLHERAWTLIH